jgi:TatD DNase family protein
MAEAVVRLGFYLSFAGIVTFPKAEALREAARKAPADRLLVETDAPYLAPVPFRGKRNEPAHVARGAERLAALRAADVAAVVAATTKNALQLFGSQALARVDTPRASVL